MSPCRQFPDDVFIAIAIHNLKPPANAAFPVLSATGQYGDFYWLSMALVLCCIWVKETPSAIRNVCAYHNSHGPVVVDKGFGSRGGRIGWLHPTVVRSSGVPLSRASRGKADETTGDRNTRQAEIVVESPWGVIHESPI